MADDADRGQQSFAFYFVVGPGGVQSRYDLDDALLGRHWLEVLAGTLSRALWWHVCGVEPPSVVWLHPCHAPMRPVAWQGVRGPDGKMVWRDDPEMAAALDAAAEEDR